MAETGDTPRSPVREAVVNLLAAGMQLKSKISGRRIRSRRVYVIVNPAAGQDQPFIKTLNTAFRAANADWDIAITKEPGDGRRLAQRAVAAGYNAVAVYGGDGTVTEVASGLAGSNVPLAILPGGTANVMSVELGIPRDLAAASELIWNPQAGLRVVDMGLVNGEYFLLRVGIGLEAQMVETADRDFKNRYGILSYSLAALQALRDPPIARYRLTLDGETVETEGLTCIIANSANLALPGLALAPGVDVADGKLDVLIVRSADLSALLSVAASVVTGSAVPPALLHWQACEIEVSADPPQTVQGDGEMLGQTPTRVKIVPQAARIIVPPTTVTNAPPQPASG